MRRRQRHRYVQADGVTEMERDNPCLESEALILLMSPLPMLPAGVFDVHSRTFSQQHMAHIDERLHECFPELNGADEARSWIDMIALCTKPDSGVKR